MPKKANPKSGRPTKLNEKTVSLLETHLQYGHSIAESCYAAKISRETFYKWYRENPQFADTMRLARVQLIRLAKQTIYAAVMKGDTKAAMWVLEKFAPDSFTVPLDDEIPTETTNTDTFLWGDENTPISVGEWEQLEAMVNWHKEDLEYRKRHNEKIRAKSTKNEAGQS